jgi:hypothetical protein
MIHMRCGRRNSSSTIVSAQTKASANDAMAAAWSGKGKPGMIKESGG